MRLYEILESLREKNIDLHEILIAMDGTEMTLPNNCQLEIHIREVDETLDTPHGYRYSLSVLHYDQTRKTTSRIFGIDNAHAPSGVKHPHDHIHRLRAIQKEML